MLDGLSVLRCEFRLKGDRDSIKLFHQFEWLTTFFGFCSFFLFFCLKYTFWSTWRDLLFDVLRCKIAFSEIVRAVWIIFDVVVKGKKRKKRNHGVSRENFWNLYVFRLFVTGDAKHKTRVWTIYIHTSSHCWGLSVSRTTLYWFIYHKV